jgi:enoyl-CoA hydratase/carnithine racemase
MQGDDDLVGFEVEAGVATITFNRPERKNAWTVPMEQRYFDLLDTATADPQVRAIVVTGAGGAFCPGMDMGALSGLAGGGKGLDRTGRRPPDTPMMVPKPMIAAVAGPCAGLGLMQACMCDVRFVARGARLSTSFSRRGLSAEYVMGWLLPRLIGMESALDLLLSGRVFGAEEAAEVGLTRHLCEPDDLLPAAQAYARDLAANCSPAAMAAIKFQVRGYQTLDLGQALDHSLALMAHFNRSPDFAEGVSSFVERRPPSFAPWAPLPPGVDPLGLVP